MSETEQRDQTLFPAPLKQEVNPLATHAENILALKILIQRVEAATATPNPTGPLSLEAHRGLFPHYGDDTKTIRATVKTPDSWQRLDIHLTTSTGREGIVAIKHERDGSGGSMEWLDGAVVIKRFGEVLDRHNVPHLPENL